MSGIFGVYHLDHTPMDSDILARMSECLAHRGPDDAGIWCKESIGLGQRMLRTTPESLHEKLPFYQPETDLAITADARIDNREELAGRLGISNTQCNRLTDSDLILAAYQKWGEHCPSMLAGDFAFAIWDGVRQLLFCARDRFGIRPFYYHHSKNIFVFGSEIKAIHCLPEAPRKLNEQMVGYYLDSGIAENAITFYQDIFRLPPGHCMMISHNGIRITRYWTANPAQEVHFRSDEDYIEAFFELFQKAVHACLRSAFPVGSELSGGLDSSSVTCMARALRCGQVQTTLHTFSCVYDQTPESDERRFIQPVIDQGGLTPHFIPLDDANPLGDLERIFWLSDETVTSPTLYIPWKMYHVAQTHGIRVMLTGLDGDTTVSHGWEYLSELAQAGNWAEFGRQIQAVAQHPNLPPGTALARNYGGPHLAGLARQWRWVAFARGANALNRYLRISRKSLIKNYGLAPLFAAPLQRFQRALDPGGPTAGHAPWLNPQFARRFCPEKRQYKTGPRSAGRLNNGRAQHAGALMSAVMPYMFEWENRVTTAFGIEGRHPFADVRLVEFCLALPSGKKLSQGWTRYIMRQAMDGLLPEEIRWRGGKTLNSAAFLRSFRMYSAPQLQAALGDKTATIGNYVNIDMARELCQRFFMQKANDDEVFQLWRIVTLALWLHHVRLAV